SHSYPLSLHDALPIFHQGAAAALAVGHSGREGDRLVFRRTLSFIEDVVPDFRMAGGHRPGNVAAAAAFGGQFNGFCDFSLVKTRSEEHTSELQSRFDL